MNFETTTQELTVNENTGKEYMRKCLYMINAESFGQAEELMTNYLNEFSTFSAVVAITISNVTFVEKFDNEFLYKMKITVPEENEETGKIKNVNYYELISADKPEEAIKKTRERYSQMYGNDYDVEQSSKTPFIDILNY